MVDPGDRAEPYSAIVLLLRFMSIFVKVQIIKLWTNMNKDGQICMKGPNFLIGGQNCDKSGINVNKGKE